MKSRALTTVVLYLVATLPAFAGEAKWCVYSTSHRLYDGSYLIAFSNNCPGQVAIKFWYVFQTGGDTSSGLGFLAPGRGANFYETNPGGRLVDYDACYKTTWDVNPPEKCFTTQNSIWDGIGNSLGGSGVTIN